MRSRRSFLRETHAPLQLLYGRNAVYEALRARRRTFRRLLIAAGAQETGTLGEILALAAQLGVALNRVDRHILNQQLPNVNHQGVVLETGNYPYVDLDECLSVAEERQEAPLLLVLDHVQDPQNVGTLLRTAEVVGTHGVLLPGRRAVEITPAVVNASSGATEHLQIGLITNVSQTMSTLQQRGIWIVGVEDDPRAKVFDSVDLDGPLALVVGAEGTGLARLTRERCDFLIRLPMRGQITSLNVAIAGSIVLYAAWRQREQGRSKLLR